MTEHGVSTRQRLTRLAKEFDNGNISAVWSGLRPLLRPGLTDADLINKRNYLQLGCALYRTGDLDAARALNRALPLDQWRPLRYRLSLRLGDTKMCKRLRSAPGATEKEQMDFRCSAGLHMLWAHKYALGFPLYTARVDAINFTRIMPARLEYAPLPADPGDDLPWIILEQGVGDVVFYLSHIRALGGHEASTFIGLPKYLPLVRRYFPDAEVVAVNRLGEVPKGTRVHAAADFLGRAYRRHGSLGLEQGLDRPHRRRVGGPVFGICWRGGSGQNRREERHIPLAYFLDLLPRELNYLTLQFDQTEAETERLQADPRCQSPIMDLTRDPLEVMDVIRGLAGVISVDSANWHFAGSGGVPVLGLMNATPHWFWGPQSRVQDAYPGGRTIAKEALSPGLVRDWAAGAVASYHDRPAPPRPDDRARNKPLFILGLPRSGTSMTARILHGHGVWMGDTVGPSGANPHGFFENKKIRETYLKGILRHIGADPLGIDPLPDADHLPPYPGLAFQLSRALREEGYAGGPWAFKDPKLSLIWPIFAEAYPDATWLIVHRDRKSVISSLCRTHFMARHSTSPDYWEIFCRSYDRRLDRLRESGHRLLELDANQLKGGDYSGITAVLQAMGLEFDPAIANAAIDAKLMGSVPRAGRRR